MGIAAALLLVQSGVGLVAALGMVVFRVAAAGGGSLAPDERLALLVPLASLGLAFGVANGYRWARWATLAVEGGVLAVTVLLHLVLPGGLDLTSAMVTLGLPSAILVVLMRPRPSGRAPSEHPLHPLRERLPPD